MHQLESIFGPFMKMPPSTLTYGIVLPAGTLEAYLRLKKWQIYPLRGFGEPPFTYTGLDIFGYSTSSQVAREKNYMASCLPICLAEQFIWKSLQAWRLAVL